MLLKKAYTNKQHKVKIYSVLSERLNSQDKIAYPKDKDELVVLGNVCDFWVFLLNHPEQSPT